MNGGSGKSQSITRTREHKGPRGARELRKKRAIIEALFHDPPDLEDKKELLLDIAMKAIRFRMPPPILKGARYAPAIVSFFDLLGFQNIVAKNSAREIAQLISVFRRTNVELARHEKVEVHSFSDSIIRVRTIATNEDFDSGQRSPLLSELKDIAHIQFELACWYGIFVRGGVAIGDVFSRRDIVFGPAVVSAYMLESKHAIFPRILIHPEFQTLIAQGSDHLLQSNGDMPDRAARIQRISDALSSILIVDQNGYISIDYLNNCIKGSDLAALEAHKAAIEQGYTSASDSRVSAKYSWLAHCHNFSIASDDWLNFREIGVTASNIDKYKVVDTKILARCAPTFRRVYSFHTMDQSALGRVDGI